MAGRNWAQLILCCAVMFISSHIVGQVVINEFMASNSSVIDDPDFGDSGDWVELFNASGGAVDLSGYYLTDNLNDTTKWAIPGGTVILANSYLLIWADGYNAGLHTNFKLSSLGEEVGLYDASEQLVDSFVYQAQQTDISRGRQFDGNDTWSWFDIPTPGESNNSSFAYEGVTFYVPFFSQKGGHFDSQQTVELTTLGGTIHYTLDGRSPTVNDDIYSGPIEFDSDTFIRARVIIENEIPGPVVTHSYFFDASIPIRGLPYVSLVTDPDFFWDADIGLYVQDFKPDWEHPVNIEFFENDGNNQSVFNERAGVKINGQNSWELPQKMLGIYFDNQYGSGNLEYPLFDDRERSVFNDIILRAGGSDWSHTITADVLCQHLTQENAPIAHQGFRRSIVFINGEYMGIHNIRSRLNGDFIEENYAMANNTFDLIDNDGDVDEGSNDQWNTLNDLLNEDLTVQSNYDLVAEFMDIENYADYWISEIWCSNGSWAHNVKMWKPLGTGKWQFILQDLDRGFSGSTDDELFEHSQPSAPDGTAYGDYTKHWLEHMTANEGFADYFIRRFNDHIYTTFHPRRVNQVIDEFVTPMIPEIPYHVERWTGTTSDYGDGIPTVEFWEDEIEGMRAFAETRHAFMMGNILSYFDLDPYVNLSLGNLPNDAGTIRINDFKVPDTPWTGPYFTDMASQVTAIPNPGYDFVGWSNYVDQSIVGLQENWKYHDQGENLGTSWREADYDDSSWAEGIAELGYGDGDESTVVSFGPDANNKFVTTYFRKAFQYSGAEGMTSCNFSVRRDDGMVAYLNGVEVARSSMPSGTINYDTFAANTAAGADEENLVEFSFEAFLNQGENVLAVEIHQVVGNSSDISFDCTFNVLIAEEDVFETSQTLDFSLNEASGFIARYVPSGACLLPDSVDMNTTLTIDCSPYLAQGNCTVLEDITLTVDPGVEIWFPEEARLIIHGDLQVNGTEAQPVIFKANEEYGAESWGNLTFDNSTAVNNLTHLIVEDATEGPHPVHHRAAISSWYSEVVMDELTLVDNLSNPIFAEYSDITLTSSEIHSAVTGDLINVKYGEAFISDCHFVGNDQVDTDAIDYDLVIDGVITDTHIEGFYGFNSDGIDLGEECVNVLIENCLIDNCTDKGVSCGQSSTGVVRNTTIVNCAQGFGIKDLGSLEIDHVSAYSNAIAVACFEKNPGLGGGEAIITNSILSNSSVSPVFVDSVSTVDATIVMYDTDTMPGETAFWADPEFVDAPHYDFNLLATSPALAAGSDGLDLGTDHHAFGGLPRVMISKIQYDHIENPDREFFSILNDGDEIVDLSGYVVSDAVTFTFPQGITLAPGTEITLIRDVNLPPDIEGEIWEWTSGQLNNAGEMIVLTDNHGIVVDHVEYAPELPWPSITIADQYLQLVSPDLDNHFASSWELSEIPTEIDEIAGEGMTLYPNPTKDLINVCGPEMLGLIQVSDMSGRLVFEQRINQSCARLNVENLQPGIYLIQSEVGQPDKFIKR